MVHIVPVFTFHGKKDDKIGTVGEKTYLKKMTSNGF